MAVVQNNLHHRFYWQYIIYDDGSRLSTAGSVKRGSERPPDVHSLPRRFDSRPGLTIE